MPPTDRPRPPGLSKRQHMMIGLAAFAVLAGVALLADVMAWKKASPTDPAPGPLEGEDGAGDAPPGSLRAADAGVPADGPPADAAALGNGTVSDGGAAPGAPAP